MADDDQGKTHIPQIKKSNQKLRVKLKIHKIKHQEQQEEEEQGDDLGIGAEIGPLKNDESRVCKVCNKGFISGKALGGHMRVHIQANKEQQQIKRMNNADTAHAGNRVICPLCPKTFPSMKSLFGHMRCHPERQWRGIQPPPHQTPAAAMKSSPVSSVSEQINLAESLRGWSSTAKRGRKALTPTTTDDPSTEEERLEEAVDYLMSLAHGDSFDSSASLTHENRVDDHEGRNGNLSEILKDENLGFQSKKRRIESSLGEYNVSFEYPVKKLKIEELSGSPVAVIPSKKILERGKGKGIVLGGIQDCEEFVEDDETGSQKSDYSIPSGNLIANCKMDGQILKIKKKRKKVKLRDLGTSTSPGVDKLNPVYKCSTCDKCFTTHQALGGHRSSHNKIRSIHYVEHHEDSDNQVPNHPPATGVDELKENGEGGGGGGGGGGSTSKVVAESSTHQCKICNKTFPTGQALGGHKRCHWTGPLEAPSSQAPLEAPSSQAGSPGEASHTGQKILGFDLNEVPAMEDEVESEHHAAGYGYASSSYNSQ